MEESKGRKIFLINPPYQLSVMFHFLILFFTVMIVTVFAINWQLEPVIEQIQLSQLPETDPLIASMANFTKMINITVIALLGFSFIMFAIMGLIVSHKSAGPIYSLTQHLRRIRSNKKVEPINFRKGDYFQELAEEINEFIDYTKTEQHSE